MRNNNTIRRTALKLYHITDFHCPQYSICRRSMCLPSTRTFQSYSNLSFLGSFAIKRAIPVGSSQWLRHPLGSFIKSPTHKSLTLIYNLHILRLRDNGTTSVNRLNHVSVDATAAVVSRYFHYQSELYAIIFRPDFY